MFKLEAYPVTFQTRVYFSSYHLLAAKHFKQLAADIENTIKETSNNRLYLDVHHRAYVVGAILSSVAFLEATINEFLKDIVDKNGNYAVLIDEDAKGQLEGLWEETEGKKIKGKKTKGKKTNRKSSCSRIIQKYDKSLDICKKEGLDEDMRQKAELVILLRNSLTHYKPESYGLDIDDIENNFLKRLQEVEQKNKEKEKEFHDNPLMTKSGLGNPNFPEDSKLANAYFPDKCLGSPCAAWAVTSTKKLADDFFQKLGTEPKYVDFEDKA